MRCSGACTYAPAHHMAIGAGTGMKLGRGSAAERLLLVLHNRSGKHSRACTRACVHDMACNATTQRTGQACELWTKLRPCAQGATLRRKHVRLKLQCAAGVASGDLGTAAVLGVQRMKGIEKATVHSSAMSHWKCQWNNAESLACMPYTLMCPVHVPVHSTYPDQALPLSDMLASPRAQRQ